eukprot:gb/GECG01002802.1/.p1 GENE.gb/GECG01002802.1/~~gb/GECG01002802.1/.p1  ORF type:complete len:302 (+),score=61.49 gb/GECG01002802.1/:1-906(+)
MMKRAQGSRKEIKADDSSHNQSSSSMKDSQGGDENRRSKKNLTASSSFRKSRTNGTVNASASGRNLKPKTSRSKLSGPQDEGAKEEKGTSGEQKHEENGLQDVGADAEIDSQQDVEEHVHKETEEELNDISTNLDTGEDLPEQDWYNVSESPASKDEEQSDASTQSSEFSQSSVDSAFSMPNIGVDNEEYLSLCDNTEAAMEALGTVTERLVEWKHTMSVLMGLPDNIQRRTTVLSSQALRATHRMQSLSRQCLEHLRNFAKGLVMSREIRRLEEEVNKRARYVNVIVYSWGSDMHEPTVQ